MDELTRREFIRSLGGRRMLREIAKLASGGIGAIADVGRVSADQAGHSLRRVRKPRPGIDIQTPPRPATSGISPADDKHTGAKQ
jgi:hypothetical protein